ncbi:MAG TPA: DUF4270 family protein [Chitinophagaceae bacterium]|jgi:hypothetical protein|nr:DUF4270 family protein [Chitinophagaceae bacterium]
MNARNWLFYVILFSFLGISCSRNEIEFGNIPDNNYTNLVSIDTVEPRLSTVVLDSFTTGSATSFLLGKYKDPYLGIISARPFFQLTIPAETVSISTTSQFDSACFIIHLNKYYYGDTTREQTIYVNELAQTIDYTYNNNLYNSTNVPAKLDALGSKKVKLRPSTDSIIIRLNNSKGAELFNKLQQRSDEVVSDDGFQNYFKGISLSVNDNDTTAIYGLNGASGNMILRIYYHTTIPYPENKWVNFPSKSNNYAFNQIVTDRTGTPLHSSTTGTKEFSSEQTNNAAFTQYGAGALLKMIFPSLKGIITTDKIVKLQKAELIIRPLGQSYDNFKFKLPSSFYLVQTNGTNTIGSFVLDSTLSVLQTASPVVDEIYGLNTYYRFNVTSYINSLLINTGTEDAGFFLLENKDPLQVNRAVIGNSKQALFKTQLLLTILTINK